MVVSSFPSRALMIISGLPPPQPTMRRCDGPSTRPEAQFDVGYVVSTTGCDGFVRLITATPPVPPSPGTVTSMRPPLRPGTHNGCSTPLAPSNGILLST